MSARPARGPHGRLSPDHCEAGETHRVGVKVNEAVGVAHGAGSVLDDPDVGRGQVHVGLQHLHDHLGRRGPVDALEHDGCANHARTGERQGKGKVRF